ncbi:MAG: hypothetical protein ACI4NA_02240 [Succinivibrio sp.]
MSWGAALAIAIPFLFVIGTVVSALKDQKKLEQGKLRKVLERRKAEQEEYFKLHGREMPRPGYDDDDDWPVRGSALGKPGEGTDPKEERKS